MAYLKIDYFSEILNRAVQMGVILPEQDQTNEQLQGYKNIPFRKDARLPVLYLLHGLTDNYSTWLRNTSIERYASERGIAVVMPEGYLGHYTDMAYGYDYGEYLTKEIPQVVQEFLPCISTERKDTFAAGNSMGGYGALKWALACPEQFSSVALFSGAMYMGIDVLNDPLHFPVRYWTDVFGDFRQFQGSRNDLAACARRAMGQGQNTTSIYMWIGIDDWLLRSNRQLKDELQRDGFPVIYNETLGGHTWADWDREIKRYLDWVTLNR